jgi:hypothetical protein
LRPFGSFRCPWIESRPCSDALAQAASWCLLMLFFCCVIYKYDSLTASDDLQLKMSSEQVRVAKQLTASHATMPHPNCLRSVRSALTRHPSLQ